MNRWINVDVSVVVVSYNTRERLCACLASLKAGLCGVSAEVWVVDNASHDGSAALVQQDYPDVHLIANDTNCGFAPACNQALRRAVGANFLLLNPDTVVPPGAVRALLCQMNHLPPTTKTGAVGPLLLHINGQVQPSWARFPTLVSELRGRLDRRQYHYPLAHLQDAAIRATLSPFAVDWVGGACLLVRRAAVEQCGLLDEGFFLYGEEVEWCHRFRQQGFGVYLVPSVSVAHIGGESTAQGQPAARRHLWHSQRRLFKMLYGPVRSLPHIALVHLRYVLYQLRNRITDYIANYGGGT